MQLNRHIKPSPVKPSPDSASYSGARLAALHFQNVAQFFGVMIDAYRPRLQKQNIKLDTDFDEFEASFDPPLIRSAATALLDNALDSMSGGGEISITLIDGRHQWEFEVADSLGMAFGALERKSENMFAELPVVIPFPQTDSLRNAHRAAMAHRGQIQTWSCPQGGTAHVLVIPRIRYK